MGDRRDYLLSAADRADYRAARKLIEGRFPSVEAACMVALQHAGQAVDERVSIETAVDRFLRRYLGGREDTYRFYEEKLSHFVRAFPGAMLDSLTRSDLKQWLEGLEKAPGTVQGRHRAVRALYRWAASCEPRLVGTDPTQGLRLDLGRRQASTHRFLNVREVEQIMRGGRSYTSALALMLFAGIRPYELRGKKKPPVLWRQVDIDRREIHITKEQSKTGRARLIEGAPDNLWLWLETDERKDEFNKPVCPSGVRQALQQAQAAAGYLKYNEDTRTWQRVREWPADALRHSFATYHVAAFNDTDRTSKLMGHEGRVELLHSTYRGLAREAEGKAYFEIGPD